MIPVKVMPRFKCDFCKKRGTRTSMEKHERICFRNPDRFCDTCKNTGEVEESDMGYYGKVPCYYCGKFDPEMLKEIEAREASVAPEKSQEETEMPF